MKRALAGAAAVVAAAAFTLWWFSDRQVVKRRTASLLDTVTIEAGSSPIGRGLQAAGIDGFLAPHVTLEVPSEEASGTHSRDDIAAGFRYVAEHAHSTRFGIERLASITMAGDHALVVATLDAEVRFNQRQHPLIAARYRTEFEWHQLDGRWRIARVTMTPAP